MNTDEILYKIKQSFSYGKAEISNLLIREDVGMLAVKNSEAENKQKKDKK